VQRFVLVSLVALLLAFSSAGAQELRLPFDAEMGLYVIDSDLASHLDRFHGDTEFQTAQLFQQVQPDRYFLEIQFRRNGQLQIRREELSFLDVEQLRREIARIITDQSRERTETGESIHLQPLALSPNDDVRDKRAHYLVGTSLISLGFYGWAVPAAFDMEGRKKILAGYMFTAAAGIIIPYAATRGKVVNDATATLSLYGATRGIVHGILLSEIIGGDAHAGRRAIITGLGVSVAEMYAGYRIARECHYSTGTAEAIGVCGDFGMLSGLGFAGAADYYDKEAEKEISLSVLSGAGLGLVAGRMITRHQDYTRGDAYLLGHSGLLGSWLAITTYLLADGEDGQTGAAIATTGALAGLALGHRLGRGRDFTSGQGIMIGLGELAGALVTTGLAYVLSPDSMTDREEAKLYTSAIALGSAAGFYTLYRSAEEKAASSHRHKVTDSAAATWRVSLAPEGFIALALSGHANGDDQYHVSPLPLLRFSYSAD
jgi:hypothetical protein